MCHVTKSCRMQRLSRNTALQRAAVPFVLHMYLYIYMLSADTKVNSLHDGLLNLYAVLEGPESTAATRVLPPVSVDLLLSIQIDDMKWSIDMNLDFREIPRLVSPNAVTAVHYGV